MSNMLYRNSIPHFQMPKAAIESGLVSKMTGSQCTLYCVLLYHCQEKSKAILTFRNDELSMQTGLTANTLNAARTGLESHGLLDFRQSGRAGCTYTLLHPETARPLLETVKGDVARLDFDTLTPDQLGRYFRHHLRSNFQMSGSGLSRCPFHTDGTPSLSIDLEKGGVWQCFGGGCRRSGKLVDFEVAIAERKGKPITRKKARERVTRVLVSTGAVEPHHGPPEATYEYRDVNGSLLFQVLRYRGKKFKQRRPAPDKPGEWLWELGSVRRVLYNLPEVAEAKTVIICEGEKDCHAVQSVRVHDGAWPVAVTTSPMGAGSWRQNYSEALRRKCVVIIPDNDEAGLRHAELVQAALDGYAAEVRVCRLPPDFKDVSDFLEERGEAELIEHLGFAKPVPI